MTVSLFRLLKPGESTLVLKLYYTLSKDGANVHVQSDLELSENGAACT